MWLYITSGRTFLTAFKDDPATASLRLYVYSCQVVLCYILLAIFDSQ